MGLIAVVSWILIDILYKVFLLVESYRLIMPLLSSIDCRPASTATKLAAWEGEPWNTSLVKSILFWTYIRLVTSAT